MPRTRIPKEQLGQLRIGDADVDGISLSKLNQSGASEGQVAQWQAGEWKPVSLMGGSVFVDNETPVGVVDGVNKTFTIAYLPSPPVSLQVFRGGVLLAQGVNNDYVIENQIITFNEAPQVNDTLVVFYRR